MYDRNVVNKYRINLLLDVITINQIDYTYTYVCVFSISQEISLVHVLFYKRVTYSLVTPKLSEPMSKTDIPIIRQTCIYQLTQRNKGKSLNCLFLLKSIKHMHGKFTL